MSLFSTSSLTRTHSTSNERLIYINSSHWNITEDDSEQQFQKNQEIIDGQ